MCPNRNCYVPMSILPPSTVGLRKTLSKDFRTQWAEMCCHSDIPAVLAADFNIRLMVCGAGLRMGRSLLFHRVQSELKRDSLGPILPNLSYRCLRYDFKTSVASRLTSLNRGK